MTCLVLCCLRSIYVAILVQKKASEWGPAIRPSTAALHQKKLKKTFFVFYTLILDAFDLLGSVADPETSTGDEIINKLIFF